MDDDPLNELCVQLLKLLCQKQTLNASPSLPYNFIVYFLPSLQSHLSPPLSQSPSQQPKPTVNTDSPYKKRISFLDTLYKILLQIFGANFRYKLSLLQIVDLISIF
jgi:hypothetical protein